MSDDPHLGPYLEVVGRVAGLARSNPEALDRPVPACPEWTAGQVVAHLTGVAEDWVGGHLDHYGSDEWAGAQVARWENRPLDETLAAWTAAAGRFARLGPSPLPGTPAMWAFGDAVVHEADLRPVLAPGTRVPGEAVSLGLKAAIARWRGELAAAGVPPLDIVATDARTWRAGDPETPAAATVTSTGHELFRALFGRRSRAQVAAWDWDGDPAVYLDVPLPSPFRWARSDLVD